MNEWLKLAFVFGAIALSTVSIMAACQAWVHDEPLRESLVAQRRMEYCIERGYGYLYDSRNGYITCVKPNQ